MRNNKTETLLDGFKKIPGFSNYGVSKDGIVFSLTTDKTLKPFLNRKNYLQVSMQDDSGNRKTMRVHRLVLLAFRGPAPKDCVGCHNDGNSQNNSLSNLRYDTMENNVEDMKKHGAFEKIQKSRVEFFGKPRTRKQKRCTNCKEFKSLNDEFYKSRSEVDKHTTVCKVCIKERDKKRRLVKPTGRKNQESS